MPLNVGDRLGHYDVTALIGEGGMREVWRAHDTQLGRGVALKVPPDIAEASRSGPTTFTATTTHPSVSKRNLRRSLRWRAVWSPP